MSTGGSKGPRLRARCWMFTIQCAARVSHESSQGGTPDEWDPAAQSFDEDHVRYVSCQLERGHETGRLHWQGYLEALQPVGLKRVKELLSCNHAHLEPRRGTQAEAIAYCSKEDTRETDEDGDPIRFEIGEPAKDGVRGKGSKNKNYGEMLQQKTYQDALLLCQELEPADYVRFNAAVRRGLMQHYLKPEVFIRPLSSFNRDGIRPVLFKTFSVVLTGKSGTGKTAYALAHFEKPYLISHLDQLKDFNPLEHDGLVFDDMSFEHFPVESCIHLVDLEYDRYIHCRHVMGFIPKGFPRFFTSNRAFNHVFNFKDANEDQEIAITRRVHHELIVTELF